MKILVLTNHSYMLYRFRRELLEELQKEHEVVLCMPFVGHEDDFQKQGFRCVETAIDRRGINPKTDLRLLLHYWKLIRTERPDLVITYSIKPNIYGGLVATLMRIPFCANVQGLGSAFQRKKLAVLVTALYKMALKGAKTVFFENEENAEAFLSCGIVRESKVTVLPGAGVNLNAYPVASYPDHDQIRFLYLGRIMKEKGIDELFAAMKHLHEKMDSGVCLDLVGFFDDDYKSQVEAMTEFGMAVFHGFQTDPKPYYAMADCIVLPSYHEGMSNVLLEAAAMGRPVITSNIPGCREAVEDGVTGLLCRVRNSDDLYDQMYRMAQLPREVRSSMGMAARRKMEREFDKKMVVAKTIQHMFEDTRGA